MENEGGREAVEVDFILSLVFNSDEKNEKG